MSKEIMNLVTKEIQASLGTMTSLQIVELINKMKSNAPNDLYVVCVYPDDEQYTEPPSWKSDDYELRATALCEECNDELDIHYQEPLASCGCGTQEWYYDYPDYKWA